MLLQLDDIHVSYGYIEALRGIYLNVGEGEIVTLLGANGAGKTTTLMTISGVLRPLRGTVIFQGKPSFPSLSGRSGSKMTATDPTFP